MNTLYIIPDDIFYGGFGLGNPVLPDLDQLLLLLLPLLLLVPRLSLLFSQPFPFFPPCFSLKIILHDYWFKKFFF